MKSVYSSNGMKYALLFIRVVTKIINTIDMILEIKYYSYVYYPLYQNYYVYVTKLTYYQY